MIKKYKAKIIATKVKELKEMLICLVNTKTMTIILQIIYI